jgi:hypothetical protein
VETVAALAAILGVIALCPNQPVFDKLPYKALSVPRGSPDVLCDPSVGGKAEVLIGPRAIHERFPGKLRAHRQYAACADRFSDIESMPRIENLSINKFLFLHRCLSNITR